MKRPFPLSEEISLVRRESWLLQFYRNAAILNFDLRLWMPALNDFTLPGGLIIGLRCLDESLVLPIGCWDKVVNRQTLNRRRPLEHQPLPQIGNASKAVLDPSNPKKTA